MDARKLSGADAAARLPLFALNAWNALLFYSISKITNSILKTKKENKRSILHNKQLYEHSNAKISHIYTLHYLRPFVIP